MKKHTALTPIAPDGVSRFAIEAADAAMSGKGDGRIAARRQEARSLSGAIYLIDDPRTREKTRRFIGAHANFTAAGRAAYAKANRSHAQLLRCEKFAQIANPWMNFDAPYLVDQLGKATQRQDWNASARIVDAIVANEAAVEAVPILKSALETALIMHDSSTRDKLVKQLGALGGAVSIEDWSALIKISVREGMLTEKAFDQIPAHCWSTPKGIVGARAIFELALQHAMVSTTHDLLNLLSNDVWKAILAKDFGHLRAVAEGACIFSVVTRLDLMQAGHFEHARSEHFDKARARELDRRSSESSALENQSDHTFRQPLELQRNH